MSHSGQRQDLQSNGVSKECILVIDREAGTITLEHVTSKVDVKQTRGEEAKEVHFKPRPARKAKSSSSSSSLHHHEGPPRKHNRPDPPRSEIKSMPKTSSGNMPEIIGMSGDSGRPSGGGESRTNQSDNLLGFLSSGMSEEKCVIFFRHGGLMLVV